MEDTTKKESCSWEGLIISRLRASSGKVYDYIIVGSGPGGGPLAANLARAGYTVALLECGIEAGDADAIVSDAQAFSPCGKAAGTIGTYSTPGAFGGCSEHPSLSWDIFVKHYNDVSQSERNDKWVPGKGILYPRGSTLGGSAAHNALVWVYPHDDDFDTIAQMTGDESWNSAAMRMHFQRLERCDYLPPSAPGHGFDGYIASSTYDSQMLDLASDWKDIAFAGAEIPPSANEGNYFRDVNHPAVAAGEMGTYITPMHASKNGGKAVRSSAREYLLQTQKEYPEKLFILTGALAAKVLIRNRVAFGVESLAGKGLYKADKNFDEFDVPEKMVCFARNEVIVSGGALNTPQLLKLSGIGPAEELRNFGIAVVQDLPGVGTNLQDRYEVYVTAKLKHPIGVVKFCKPGVANDPCARAYASGEWVESTKAPFYGPYASNFICATRITKSSRARRLPDLFLVGLPYPFTGYFPGHSKKFDAGVWTWLVIKCRNRNTGGVVKLRSSDPRDTPDVIFNYFEEGNDLAGDDLQALLEGIKVARKWLADPQAAQHIDSEIFPGAHVQTDDDLKSYIRDQSWGHHASCTAQIGKDGDPMAVLDSQFRVRGIDNLRVVDASVFPRLPGYFPVAAVYMISEKASDVILDRAQSSKGSPMNPDFDNMIKEYSAVSTVRMVERGNESANQI
jgi:choline dehydrogenase